MSRVIRVLSIDGGGVRGIVPAVMLDTIERVAGRPIFELFDLVSGTSTGAILAASVAKPNPTPASVLIDLYVRNARRIFRENPIRVVSSLVISAKFDHAVLEGVLREAFGTIKLSDCTTNLLIPAYDIESRDAKFFKSWRARGVGNPVSETPRDADFFLADVVRASTAAPTYFEPAYIHSISGTGYACIDGAIFANNPSMCALSSARRLWPNETEFMVVSLGTGQLAQPICYGTARKWGLVDWARPSLDCMMDGMADVVDYQMGEAFPNGLQYVRFQTDMRGPAAPTDKIDDITNENIRRLIVTGQTLARERMDDIAMMLPVLNGLL